MPSMPVMSEDSLASVGGGGPLAISRERPVPSPRSFADSQELVSPKVSLANLDDGLQRQVRRAQPALSPATSQRGRYTVAVTPPAKPAACLETLRRISRGSSGTSSSARWNPTLTTR